MRIQSQPIILLTRPLAQSQRFAQDLTGNVILSPLMEPEFLAQNEPKFEASAVVFTSETGVKAAAQLGWNFPKRAFCVGAQTASVAREKGWDAVAAGGNAADLMALILRQKDHGPIWILRGENSARNLQEDFVSMGIEAYSSIVYRQLTRPLSASATEQLRGTEPVFLPLFSPHSARLLSEEYRRIRGLAPLYIAAISAAVTRAFSAPIQGTEVASAPNATAVQEALKRLVLKVHGACS